MYAIVDYDKQEDVKAALDQLESCNEPAAVSKWKININVNGYTINDCNLNWIFIRLGKRKKTIMDSQWAFPGIYKNGPWSMDLFII